MSEIQWNKEGASFSHNNACKEFGLTENEIVEAIKAGKLNYLINYAHGNPYYKLLRVEVAALTLELRGANGVEDQELNFQLKKINTEINSHKRKLSSLEKQKIKLLEIQKQRQSTCP